MAGKKDRVVLRASMLDSVRDERRTPGNKRARLSFREIELAYQKDALVYHGVNKKSIDTTKKWHYFESSDPSENDPDAAVVATLSALERRVRVRRAVTGALKDVILYGDAYLELVRENDASAPESELPRGRLAALTLICPSTIRRVRDTTAGSPTNGEVLYYEQKVNGTTVQLHPSRVLHLQVNKIGDDDRGLGAVEAAYYNIVAKGRGDVALGDILVWYGKGFYSLTTKDATEEEILEAYKLLRKAKDTGDNIFAGSDRHEFRVESAAVVNPVEFLQNFYYNLAAAFDMPKDVLIGASAGTVSGSETNLRDYYEANDGLLKTYVEPFVDLIYAAELNVGVDELPVRIVWHPLYVNEKTEADTLFQNAQAAGIAWKDGVITKNEYRARVNLDPVPDGDSFFVPEPAPVFDYTPTEQDVTSSDAA